MTDSKISIELCYILYDYKINLSYYQINRAHLLFQMISATARFGVNKELKSNLFLFFFVFKLFRHHGEVCITNRDYIRFICLYFTALKSNYGKGWCTLYN